MHQPRHPSTSTTQLVLKRPQDCKPGEESMSLLALCEALHMAATGAERHRIRRAEVEVSLEALRARLQQWLPSPEFSARYDSAIRALVEATLAEWTDPRDV